MVNALRGVVSAGLVAALAALVGTWLSAESAAQTDKPSMAGEWTLNKDLSDPPPDRAARGDGSQRGDRGGYGGGRHRGGGGFGGGGGRGGYGGGQPRMDPEAAQRMRDAMRDITNPPERITVTQTDTMVVITTADGRTTRLAPDGKKIKDENTGIERKTHWDAGKLVTEISGPNGLKVTQTYALNPELHQLRLTTQMDGQRGGQARTISAVYDAPK